MWQLLVNDYLLPFPSGKWIMKEPTLFHINASFPSETTCILSCFFACMHSRLDCACASLNLRNSLVSQKARITKGLHLHSHVCDFLPDLGFNDGPIDVLLQVDESPVVAHRLTGRDVRFLYEVGGSRSVRSHDVVHVHADGVADFGRQRCWGGWRGPGLTLPWWIFRKLENDTLRTHNKYRFYL